MYIRLLNRYGVFRVMLAIILFTDITSGLLTFLFLRIVQGSVTLAEMATAVLLPTVIAPFIVYTSLRNMLRMHRMERELIEKNEALETALGEIRQLSGLLPICSSCKKIRDDKGYWNQLETYISTHSDVKFSHGICPDCAKVLYADTLKNNKPIP